MFVGVAGMGTVASNISELYSNKSSKLERRGAARLCGLFRETTSPSSSCHHVLFRKQDRLRESKQTSLFILFPADIHRSIDTHRLQSDCLFQVQGRGQSATANSGAIAICCCCSSHPESTMDHQQGSDLSHGRQPLAWHQWNWTAKS